MGILLIINTIVSVLISVALMTTVERNLIAGTQNSSGPNNLLFGLLQPVADAFKLLFKEQVFPSNIKFGVFVVAPAISLIFAFFGWCFIPFSSGVILANINLGLMFVFIASILHVYGIILAGWASNSNYSFLGAVSSSAQLLAYDITLGLCIVCLTIFTRSLNITDIVELQANTGWNVIYLFPIFIIFYICALAEMNRHPFDMPEAESELVGGYTTEYSSIMFAFFFLAEYCSMLMMSFIIVHLFLGGWLVPGIFLTLNITILNSQVFWFSLNILCTYYSFLLISAGIPRYRYDQLMNIGWKVLLPISFSLMCYYCFIEAVVAADVVNALQLNNLYDFWDYWINYGWSGVTPFSNIYLYFWYESYVRGVLLSQIHYIVYSINHYSEMPDVLTICDAKSLDWTVFDVYHLRLYCVGFCVEVFNIIFYLFRFECHWEVSLTEAFPWEPTEEEPYNLAILRYMTQDTAHMRAFGWGITALLGDDFWNTIPVDNYWPYPWDWFMQFGVQFQRDCHSHPTTAFCFMNIVNLLIELFKYIN